MGIIFWAIFFITFVYTFIIIILELIGVGIDIYYDMKKKKKT